MVVGNAHHRSPRRCTYGGRGQLARVNRGGSFRRARTGTARDLVQHPCHPRGLRAKMLQIQRRLATYRGQSLGRVDVKGPECTRKGTDGASDFVKLSTRRKNRRVGLDAGYVPHRYHRKFPEIRRNTDGFLQPATLEYLNKA